MCAHIFANSLSLSLFPDIHSHRVVWPDLAKFHHFCNILWIFVKWLRVYSVFGKMFNLLWQNCIVFGHSFNVLHCQKFRKIKKSPGHTVTELEWERECVCSHSTSLGIVLCILYTGHCVFLSIYNADMPVVHLHKFPKGDKRGGVEREEREREREREWENRESISWC